MIYTTSATDGIVRTLRSFRYDLKELGIEKSCAHGKISHKRHSIYPNLVMFKYDQIESPMSDPRVQICSGLILDEANEWKCVSFPFTKFFNYKEGHAAPIDWFSANVAEKLDGSLMTLYFYDGKWMVASNGTPDGSGDVYNHHGNFADMFWETWGEHGYKMPNKTDCCYMFELMTPHNRVIVPHSERKLVCLGGRNLKDFVELDPNVIGCELGYKVARQFPLTNLDDVIFAAKELNPMQSEGFVVTDKNWNRVKIKSPQYVALSHMKDEFSVRRMLEVVRANESDEFLTYFPEMKETYTKIKEKFDGLVEELESVYARIKHIDDKKEFALLATKTRFSAALFSVHQNRSNSIRHYLAEVSITTLESKL